MSTSKKLLEAASGGAGGDALTVDQVFSTYLYNGNGSTQTITNGIDLAGEGGLTWVKDRLLDRDNILIDTERGGREYLFLPSTDGENTRASGLTFNVDGFTTSTGDGGFTNFLDRSYASWTFRKAPKFFTLHTFTHSNATSSSYNFSNDGLTSLGMVIIKRLDAAGQWRVWHRSATSGHLLKLNSTNASASDVTFSVSGTTATMVGGEPSGQYIWYAWADNSSEGAADQMIKCGSYTHPNDTSTVSVDLGWEPQWILFKANQASTNWYIFDTMRGIVDGGFSGDGDAALFPNLSNAENVNTWGVDVKPTGFDVAGNNIGSGGNTIIYCAIRAPMMAEVTDATKVFAVSQQISNGTGPSYVSNFPVDMAINRYTSGTDAGLSDRLRGAKDLLTTHTLAEYSNSVKQFDFSDGYYAAGAGANSSYYSWMWKRAKSYFDCVVWKGSSSSTANIAHSLSVAPQMIWAKNRNDTDPWVCYHEFTGNTGYLPLNLTSTFLPNSAAWNNTTPTETAFSVGNTLNWSSSYNYIAYLFATLAGVSKVSSIVHSGTTHVDAGFTNGSRFVLLKRTDASGDWLTYDSTRGIVSGNDPYLRMNSTAAQVTNTDYIDPYSAGFTLTSSLAAGTYIYYAIA